MSRLNLSNHEDDSDLDLVIKFNRFRHLAIRVNSRLMELNSLLQINLNSSNEEVETLSCLVNRLKRNVSNQELTLFEWLGRLGELKRLLESKDEKLRQAMENVGKLMKELKEARNSSSSENTSSEKLDIMLSIDKKRGDKTRP